MMVRTRFAPSPTGFLHLGNARTALFAFLYAKHCKGQFILRIEDTDEDRLVSGSEEAIYRDLRWLGLHWDEGPEVGGPMGPYRCSERKSLYESYLKKLSKMTRVYRCFATAEELDQERKLQISQGRPIKYSGRYRSLSDQESQKKADAGEKFVWRMFVDEKADPIVIQDVIRGEVKMSPEVMGDFVLFRSTGVPVFLFANAVDDALMEITHVTRGEDHLSNTFRQVLIFRALGFKEPVFAHLPMIGDSDGGKFSKRAGSLSIENLKNDGYLPEGLVNYLSLLGWSPGDTSETGEKFKMDDLIRLFDLNRVNKSRALFDFKKLNFINSQHLQDRSNEELAGLVPCQLPEWKDKWVEAISLVKHDSEVLNDLRKVEKFLKAPSYEDDSEAKAVLADPICSDILSAAVNILQKEKNTLPIEELLSNTIKAVGKEKGVKGKALFFPFRAALTGVVAGPEMVPLSKLLGADEVIKRLERAIDFSKSQVA
jgi:glutamyl-tRNA synthetase